jgi:hypothetical protein
MWREQKTKQGELDFGCPAGERVEPSEPRETRSIGTPEAMDGDRAKKLLAQHLKGEGTGTVPCGALPGTEGKH